MRAVFVWAVVFVLGVNAAQAQTESSSLCTGGYNVYFGNGIRTDLIAAQGGAAVVRNLVGSEYEGEPVEVFVSYNPTDGTLRDLLEAFAQKRAEDPTLSWQLFFRWVSGQFVSTSLAVALSDYFGSDGAQRIANAAAQLSSPESFEDPTVVDHAQTYESALLSGKRVVVVSHSQGNLYANAVYQRLEMSGGDRGYDLGAFGIAAVASPANFVATSDGYITSDTDLVIDAVRLISPGTLPANDESVPSFPPEDRLGHDFSWIYANANYSIAQRTANVIGGTLSRVSEVEPAQSTSGPITATLTWSSPADLDLHTYECPAENELSGISQL